MSKKQIKTKKEFYEILEKAGMCESIFDFASILNLLCIHYKTQSEIEMRNGNKFIAEDYERRGEIIFEELLQRGIYD